MLPQELLEYQLDGQELTPREISVLRFAAYGMSSRATAKSLSIGFETVRSHKRTARAKLRARNTTHAVAIAVATELI